MLLLSFSIFIGMENEQKFFVYVDFRGDDGKPFYVGKGTERRVQELKRNVVHSRIKNKHGMFRKTVFETHSEQESLEKEIQLIRELQTHIDHGNGGANFTLGGEGISGYKHSDEQREKMSETHKKRWEDPKQREKKSESSKKLWEDPEYRKKLKESMESVHNDPVVRKKMSESSKKLWEDPVYREKVSKRIKDHHNDPEFRKKQEEKAREALSDPEIRKKISEKVKLSAEKLTPEQRSENTRKGWETRRLKKLQQEV
jgi:hypothetical protein